MKFWQNYFVGRSSPSPDTPQNSLRMRACNAINAFEEGCNEIAAIAGHYELDLLPSLFESDNAELNRCVNNLELRLNQLNGNYALALTPDGGGFGELNRHELFQKIKNDLVSENEYHQAIGLTKQAARNLFSEDITCLRADLEDLERAQKNAPDTELWPVHAEHIEKLRSAIDEITQSLQLSVDDINAKLDQCCETAMTR